MSRRRIEGWKTRYGTSHTPVYSISSFILRRRRCRPLTSVGFQPYHVDCNKYNTIESDADGLGIAGGRTIGRGGGGYVMYFVVAHTSYEDVTYVVPRRWIHFVVDGYSKCVRVCIQIVSVDDRRRRKRLTNDRCTLIYCLQLFW